MDGLPAVRQSSQPRVRSLQPFRSGAVLQFHVAEFVGYLLTVGVTASAIPPSAWSEVQWPVVFDYMSCTWTVAPNTQPRHDRPPAGAEWLERAHSFDCSRIGGTRISFQLWSGYGRVNAASVVAKAARTNNTVRTNRARPIQNSVQ